VICASDACPAFGVATSPWCTISKPRGHSLALQVYWPTGGCDSHAIAST